MEGAVLDRRFVANPVALPTAAAISTVAMIRLRVLVVRACCDMGGETLSALIRFDFSSSLYHDSNKLVRDSVYYSSLVFIHGNASVMKLGP